MNIFILAGEPSGDEYGAKIIKNMLSINPEVNFFGIGGSLMEKEGLQSMVNFNKMSVMGFIEIIKTLPFFLSLEKRIIKNIQEKKPDKIILIDYPGLNLRLCKKIKENVKTQIYYYISPQVWAWKEKRIETIKKYVDKMIVIFDFERNWYNKKNINVEYFGHPFLDVWEKNNTQNFIDNNNINSSKPILTLFPGSREQEVNKHLTIMIEAALIVKKNIPALQIIIGLHQNIQLNNINISDDIIIIRQDTLKALEIADGAIIASGTATLQSAIMNTPAIVIYKMNKLSWLLAKNYVKVRFASIVNIIANQEVFPELLQEKATSKNIAEKMMKIINDENYNNHIKKQLKALQKTIGEAGASKKIAKFILKS